MYEAKIKSLKSTPFFQTNISNDSTDSNAGANYYVTGSCGGMGLSGSAGGTGMLGPTALSHHQRVGSFRSRLKKQHPICMPDPPPIVVETPSKTSKSSSFKSHTNPHAKPTMVVFGPSSSVDSGSTPGMTSSRVAVSVHMCDDSTLPGTLFFIISWVLLMLLFQNVSKKLL
jgi:hypothetical protein